MGNETSSDLPDSAGDFQPRAPRHPNNSNYLRSSNTESSDITSALVSSVVSEGGWSESGDTRQQNISLEQGLLESKSEAGVAGTETDKGTNGDPGDTAIQTPRNPSGSAPKTRRFIRGSREVIDLGVFRGHSSTQSEFKPYRFSVARNLDLNPDDEVAFVPPVKKHSTISHLSRAADCPASTVSSYPDGSFSDSCGRLKETSFRPVLEAPTRHDDDLHFYSGVQSMPERAHLADSVIETIRYPSSSSSDSSPAVLANRRHSPAPLVSPSLDGQRCESLRGASPSENQHTESPSHGHSAAETESYLNVKNRVVHRLSCTSATVDADPHCVESAHPIKQLEQNGALLTASTAAASTDISGGPFNATALARTPPTAVLNEALPPPAKAPWSEWITSAGLSATAHPQTEAKLRRRSWTHPRRSVSDSLSTLTVPLIPMNSAGDSEFETNLWNPNPVRFEIFSPSDDPSTHECRMTGDNCVAYHPRRSTQRLVIAVFLWLGIILCQRAILMNESLLQSRRLNFWPDVGPFVMTHLTQIAGALSALAFMQGMRCVIIVGRVALVFVKRMIHSFGVWIADQSQFRETSVDAADSPFCGSCQQDVESTAIGQDFDIASLSSVRISREGTSLQPDSVMAHHQLSPLPTPGSIFADMLLCVPGLIFLSLARFAWLRAWSPYSISDDGAMAEVDESTEETISPLSSGEAPLFLVYIPVVALSYWIFDGLKAADIRRSLPWLLALVGCLQILWPVERGDSYGSPSSLMVWGIGPLGDTMSMADTFVVVEQGLEDGHWRLGHRWLILFSGVFYGLFLYTTTSATHNIRKANPLGRIPLDIFLIMSIVISCLSLVSWSLYHVLISPSDPSIYGHQFSLSAPLRQCLQASLQFSLMIYLMWCFDLASIVALHVISLLAYVAYQSVTAKQCINQQFFGALNILISAAMLYPEMVCQ